MIIKKARPYYRISHRYSALDTNLVSHLQTKISLFAIEDTCAVLDEMGLLYDVHEYDPSDPHGTPKLLERV